MYYGGYRYNQPNHVLHMFLMAHSFAYFTFDSLIEVYYKSDSLLTNVHHVVVVAVTYFHIKSYTTGFEYVGNLFIM